MNRRTFLKAIRSVTLLTVLPRRLWADTSFHRCRPADAAWPSQAAWKQLNAAVGGNLIRVSFPLSVLKTDPDSAAAALLAKNIKNPYYIGDTPGLTQSLGWVEAWATQPSVYAVAARNAQDIAEAVNFARQNNLRLVVKGGGHSYQGTSNAPDSLLIWTRHMHEITMHDAFVPSGCESTTKPQPAVSVGAGTIGMQAYDAVTTKGGRYVQGGGCTTVCLGGLVQGGGFGSYSKHYGTAAGSLLEAEIVTADGQIRIANACTNPDLFWALKGGGGGTFGVVSKMTLRTHDLPEFFGVATFTIKAGSEDAYRRLIREFVRFYRENLFNDHWGEQVHLNPSNTLVIQMESHGLDRDQLSKAWQPFLDWAKRSPDGYSVQWPVTLGCIPARHRWDAQWWSEDWPEIVLPRDDNPMRALFDDALADIYQPAVAFDDRPGAEPNNMWWKGNTGECGIFWWGYESLWLPASLLEDAAQQQRLADALFAASRYSDIGLHFNKGLAGAPSDAIALAKDTATNPAVLTAFALAIVANGQGPAYPGIPGREPSVEEGRQAAQRIDQCVNQLRSVAPHGGAYVSESNFFEKDWQHAYWGSNYPRLIEIKRKYDPEGLFFVHNGVGSEQWSTDGFTRL
ncbi:MAG TPA: FAD-binding oxidoreductase [Candidatus Binataceae bacterium]|nr:FAD-binding oxidoreductase [Candidatus Binataceae bacterium]